MSSMRDSFGVKKRCTNVGRRLEVSWKEEVYIVKTRRIGYEDMEEINRFRNCNKGDKLMKKNAKLRNNIDKPKKEPIKTIQSK